MPIHTNRNDCPIWLNDPPEPGVCLCDNLAIVNDTITALEEQIPQAIERLRQIYRIRDGVAESAQEVIHRLMPP